MSGMAKLNRKCLAPLFNERDAADYLGVKPGTMRTWRWLGIGPKFVRLSGRAIRYDGRDLAAFVAERTCVPAEAA